MRRKKRIDKLKFILIFLSTLLFGILLVSAITITQITPTGNIVTSNSSQVIQYNFTTDTLTNLSWNWDSTNYSLYDDSLVLFMNFDNRSALSECTSNLTGCVKDISKYGNNGTLVGNWNESGDVVSNNITWTPNGKYGGAFNFSGGVNYITGPTNLTNDKILNETYSIWVKSNGISSGATTIAGIIGTMGTTTGAQNPHTMIRFNNNVQTQIVCETCASGCGNTNAVTISLNTWYLITCSIVNNGTNNTLSIYKNGELQSSKVVDGSNYAVNGSLLLIGAQKVASNRFSNMTVDDAMVWNRSLSSSEVSQLYNSQLTKYDLTNWSYQTNQTLGSLNSTTPTDTFNYNLCVNNGTQACSPTQTITQTIPNKNLIANFTNSVGNIRSDFYGTNLQGFWILSDVETDYQWHRNEISNIGITTFRYDMPLRFSYNTTGKPFFNSTSGIDNYINLVQYAKENNIKILFISDYMPNWLADKSSGYCNLTTQENFTCPPSNYSLYGDLVHEFLKNVSCDANTCEVDVWNEPNEPGFWMNNISDTNITRSIELNKLINASYQAVQRFNSSMQVFAPSTHIYGTANTILWQNFMSNFSSGYPNLHFAFHYISTDYDTSTVLDTIYGNCSTYNFDCSRIYDGEWKHKNSTEQNTTSLWYKWSENIAYAYATELSRYPANISSSYYKWTSNSKYNTSDLEYPLVAKMVSSPRFDNTYYPPYNVTKNFAHLCPAGATVRNITIDNPLITVRCDKGLQKSMIVINPTTTSYNLSINLSSSGITTATDYLNHSRTFTNGNSVIMDGYSEGGNDNILYLTEDLQSPTITIDSPTASTYTTTNIDFNITLDEEGDTCIYSLNNFLTNYSMTKQGYINEFKASRTVPEGYSTTVNFWCNDTSGNSDTDSITFDVSYSGALTACQSSTSAFISYVSLLGLVGMILFFGWIIGYLFGFVNKDTFHKVNMVGGITTLILVGILIIISVFILSTMCSIF